MIKLTSLMFAAGLAAASVPASAQAPSDSAQQVQARTQARIASLHAQLHITPAQEPAWQAFTAVMKENAQDMTAAMEQRQKNFGAMNAVQDLQDYVDLSTEQAQRLGKLVAPFQTLYAQFSPEQKKTADAIFHTYTERGPRAHG